MVKLEEYSDKYLSDLDSGLKDKVDLLINYFNEYGIDYDNFPIDFEESDFDKKAYPNNDSYMSVPGQFDVSKWIASLKEIYFLQKKGFLKKDCIAKITNNWSDTEKFNFLNWIKFYEEGSHLKYKKAQMINGLPHYFLDLKPKQNPELESSRSANSISLSEKKQIIERQRNKIISRLDSAEKLLRSEDGNLFAGTELESLIDSIYSLKKKIQVVNKLSLNSSIYEDMIIRKSNDLKRKGFIKGSELLLNLAQDSLGLSGPALTPTPAMSPQTGGQINTEPYHAPIPDDNVLSPGITGFLDNLETGSFTPKKDLEVVEELIDEQDVLDSNESDDEVIIVEAQAIPSPTNPQPRDQTTQPHVPMQGTTNTTKVTQQKPDKLPGPNLLGNQENKTSQIDTVLNSIFANITINDVIDKLEDLSNIFSAREIPRQLALVDMMLNSLGISQYFPSLPEATEKALDSHNYMSSRIDDILSKLKNTVNDHSIDLRDHSSNISKQNTDGLKNKLQQDEENEELRKQRRKEKENKKLEQEFKEVPEMDLQQELANENNKTNENLNKFNPKEKIEQPPPRAQVTNPVAKI